MSNIPLEDPDREHPCEYTEVEYPMLAQLAGDEQTEQDRTPDVLHDFDELERTDAYVGRSDRQPDCGDKHKSGAEDQGGEK